MGLEGKGIVNVPSPQVIDLVDLEGRALLPLKFLLRRLAEELRFPTVGNTPVGSPYTVDFLFSETFCRVAPHQSLW